MGSLINNFPKSVVKPLIFISNYLRMNFRNGNYTATNLKEYLLKLLSLFFHTENCNFVSNHYCKLALDLNQHLVMFNFSTISQIRSIICTESMMN